MPRIVECVPNFSEGRRPDVIEALAEAVRSTPGARLLGVEPDADYNRVVVTLVGEPDAVVNAAFAATAVAAQKIDMRVHSGGHPRLGATDVVPFIPVAGVAMDDCVQCARRYGERVARDLGIPIYLYEEAATRPERKNLADVRKGQYEGLEEKLKDPEWAPDFGEARFNAQSGATVTGARRFLIAYNVNLATADLSLANEISGLLRESGTLMRDAEGRKVLGPDGEPKRVPGRLKNVKALGVAVPERGVVQVSMNLTDFEVTPPHVAFEEVRREAERLGLRVTGSEIVGLTPLRALLMAGEFYLQRKGDEAELLDAAIEGLGLNDFGPFAAKEKVIELCLRTGDR